VFAIVQGKHGYLWIGARDGLFRFDGIHFEKIEPEKRIPNRVSMVATLLVARDGAIWVGYQSGGVAVYRNGVLRDTGLVSDYVGHLTETPDGTIWASFESATTRVARYAHGRWDFSPNKALPNLDVASIMTTRDGTLWVDQNGSVSILRKGANKFERFLDARQNRSVLAEDSVGRVWLSDDDGSRVIFPRNTKLAGRQSYPTPGFPRDLVTTFDRDGNLWGKSGTDGIFRLSRPDPRGAISPTRADIDYYLAKDGLSSKTVISMLVDREDNIWVGTATSLERFRPVNLVTEPALTEPGLWGFPMFSGADGTVYIGQRGSVYRIRPGGRPELFLKRKSDAATICEGADHSLWFFLTDEVARFRDGHWSYLPLPPSTRPDAPVNSCAPDRNGDLWVNGTTMRARWNGKRWESFPSPVGVFGGVIVRHSNGGLVGSYDPSGLAPMGPSLSLLKVKAGNALSALRSSYVRPNDFIVGGVYGLTRVRGRHVDFLNGDRYPSVALTSGIVVGPDGVTWLMTQKGVVRIRTDALDKAFSDPRYRLPTTLLDVQDGLPGPGIPAAYDTAVRGGDGRLWFATTAGVVRVDPSVYRQNQIQPSVVIASLKAGNTLYRDPTRVVLPAGTSGGEIDFAALSLAVPKRVEVRYKLEGVDADWVDPGLRREMFFNNLGPGKYRFRVIAANDNGVWNREGASLEFTIPPTFLQSNAFKIMCAFLVGLLLWVAYLLRLRQITGRLRERLELRLAERERIARELHDTLLQGIQALILRVQSIANRLGSNTALQTELVQAIDRAEAVLIEGRDRVREVRAQTAEGDLAEAFLAVSASMPEEPAKHFDLLVEGVERELHPLVHQEVRRIGEEAIRNAYTHSSGSLIEVRIGFHPRRFYMSVRDDGAGLPPEVLLAGALPGHYGLPGMRERADRIRAIFVVDSRPGSGTEIRLTLSGRSAYRSQGSFRSFLTSASKWISRPPSDWSPG
jgi:signal transduction histidine kinase/ligand-binding sensor domain-containing protein